VKWTVNALPSKCPVSAVVAKIADVMIEVVAAPVLALDLARAHALEAEEAEAEAEVETVVTEAIVASTVVIWAIGLEIALNPVLGKSLYLNMLRNFIYIHIVLDWCSKIMANYWCGCPCLISLVL
jgi:hypothetical protein